MYLFQVHPPSTNGKKHLHFNTDLCFTLYSFIPTHMVCCIFRTVLKYSILYWMFMTTFLDEASPSYSRAVERLGILGDLLYYLWRRATESRKDSRAFPFGGGGKVVRCPGASKKAPHGLLVAWIAWWSESKQFDFFSIVYHDITIYRNICTSIMLNIYIYINIPSRVLWWTQLVFCGVGVVGLYRQDGSSTSWEWWQDVWWWPSGHRGNGGCDCGCSPRFGRHFEIFGRKKPTNQKETSRKCFFLFFFSCSHLSVPMIFESAHLLAGSTSSTPIFPWNPNDLQKISVNFGPKALVFQQDTCIFGGWSIFFQLFSNRVTFGWPTPRMPVTDIGFVPLKM